MKNLSPDTKRNRSFLVLCYIVPCKVFNFVPRCFLQLERTARVDGEKDATATKYLEREVSLP